MKKILVVGDSWTHGFALENTIHNPKLWVNQIISRMFPESSVENLALPGRNNNWIFVEAASALTKKDYDLAIIGWSTIPRYTMNVGLETYETHCMFRDKDININPGVTFKGKWLKEIGNNLLKLHNDHWDLLNLVKYVSILVNLQTKLKGKHVFFVNAIGPWPTDYFVKKPFVYPNELNDFLKNILQVETRDDEEIHKLYEMIYTQYESAGGIQELHWLNLYESLLSKKIDNNPDALWHPGPQSHDLYADFLSKILAQKLGM